MKTCKARASTPTSHAERDWHDAAGGWLASVVRHPRIASAWLAMICPAMITRDKPSGWYRYNTHKGAVALVERKILANTARPE